MQNIRNIQILVTGRVQGVYFRQSTHKLACELGLKGYVRNLSDGRVEIIASGRQEDLDSLIEWARHGPPSAEVKALEIKELPPQVFAEFQVIR